MVRNRIVGQRNIVGAPGQGLEEGSHQIKIDAKSKANGTKRNEAIMPRNHHYLFRAKQRKESTKKNTRGLEKLYLFFLHHRYFFHGGILASH
mmetsp:Transcript_16365/g.33609  ORF Transcript_16365/g.33609 Transcript_16365/m.33609 type:complete len:92 (-) Transcript_16365:56-331(-)